ncbi:hypothetical protein XELAEV_18018724mg [Xenopus laevis]|uniref:G-protein coupled receptors family 1 profile domain-containing protein n=1 Tax=Xenopus laevis TaxID=8355 RepID=A0A974HU24_XENLA|nr:hypothetical protein XELAEV_18018724mg [Xenopus laevis]
MNKNTKNGTLHTVFHIAAFSVFSEERLLFFTGFLAIYLIAVTGNLLIIYLVYLNSRLHTSMYFFLCNLSILDVLYISSTLPKLLYIIYTGDRSVSYNVCLTQLYFFDFFADTEPFLITSMAIDRYMAVCKPLHYSLIMNKRTCIILAVTAWCMAVVNALMLSWLVFSLSFNDSNQINNFFCDLKALLSVSCSDTTYIKSFILAEFMCIGVVPLGLTLASYVSIIYTIVTIQYSEGRIKAFSSCSSHLCLVILYYGSAFCLYMRNSEEGDLIFSLMFVVLVPFFNPLIYSLRNKDILSSLKRVLYCNKTMS